MRVFHLLATSAVLTLTVGLMAPDPGSAATGKPRWVLHVERHSGGISNSVRFSLDPVVKAAQRQYAARVAAPASVGTTNVQMNDDSFPGLPQNEEAIAASTDDRFVAVGAANDYVSGGVVVMRTSDGGQHWKSTRVSPQFSGNRDFCTGGDPAVAYSTREHAFYMSQLCFFRSEPFSEVHVFKSLDNGKTWTPGAQAAIAATNFDYATGDVDTSIFNDKEYIAVDNNPGSPFFGRIYVSYTRFHIAPDGSSDSCPIQLSFTASIPSRNPRL